MPAFTIASPPPLAARLRLRKHYRHPRQDVDGYDFLYLLEAHGLAQGALYKVGITHSVPYRLASLQAGCPVRLTVHSYVELPETLVWLVEQELHRNFTRHREAATEWFSLTPAEVRRCQLRMATVARACFSSDVGRVKPRRWFLASSRPMAQRPAAA